MFPGFGTLVNIVTIVVGSTIGLLLGARLPRRIRLTVTDALGLVTLLIGGLAAVEVTSSAFSSAVGRSAPVLIVLGSLLIGGIIGSLLDLERRLEDFGGWLRFRLGRGRVTAADHGTDAAEDAARERFIEGFVSTSLIFCVGPLAVLGSLFEGIGLGSEQLILKATLDGFASIAFAASLGIGVMAAAVAVAVVQGALTLVGFLVGDVLPEAHLAAITAVGGLLLIGVGIRLLQIKAVPVGNLLPALLVAPLLVQLVAVLR
ncbi:MAG: DUF554 domain-containing protein [Microlunatus sp.]|nr:DUF554 domain-containing protein [Microlunatus sp.]